MREEAGRIYRGIDDANMGGGTVDERVYGFHAAMCPPPWLEVPGADGEEWRLPDACDYAAFCALLRKMRKGKAASLDRVSKEMLELLPDDLRRAFYVAAMGVATPDEQGVRSKPEYWSRVPVKLLNKKVPSPVVEKKRDIGLPSQLLKLQAGLYLPAYAAVMDRIPANFGWTPGVAARGAALCGGLVLDHAHLLSHLLIVIYGDIRRFFPSMDRDFILISEQWRGLPRDVREATLALYDDSCILYETEHGLAEGAALPGSGRGGGDFDFTTMRSRCGYFQGCFLSTEKAKIFMASLIEAIDTMVSGGGVRLWNGVPRGGRRYQTILCADDILGSVTSWPAASVLALIMDEWADASASHFGITDDASKSAYSAVTFDGSGVPREAPAPPSFLAVAFIRGRAIPRLPFDATYTHVGDPRKLNGDQSGAQGKNGGLCMAWLKRVEQMIRCSPREYARVTNVGFASIIDAYSPLGPLTAAAAEAVEKTRRSIYKRRFRRLVSASCADRYLPDVWHAAPNFGLITEGTPEARRVGDGWLHCASLNAASIHATISAAISDGIDSQLRFCARSLLSLTCFLWGSFGAHPAEWSWGHLDELLASGDATLGSSPVGRIFPIEVYMKHVAMLRRLAALSDPERAPSFNFTLEHAPSAGDPFDRAAVIYSPLSHDSLRLFEGDLISDAACLRLGRKRRPVWLLLSAGIVVRAHACRSDGTAFMTFDEAAMVVPAFARRGGPALLASRKAWDRLILDLSRLDVAPVPGEGVHDAQQVWRGEARPSPGAPDGDASTGPRDSLDALIQRMERGEVAAAEEWARAYRTWAAAPAPPQCARPLPSPSAEELSGPHTRYIVPGRGGTTETIVRGRDAPGSTAEDATLLARFRAQRWRIGRDGRSLRCQTGSSVAQASVIVQLYAASLPIAIEAYDRERLSRAKRLTVCRPLPQGHPISASTAPRENGPVELNERLPRSCPLSSRRAITVQRSWSLSLACRRNSKLPWLANCAVGAVYSVRTTCRL